MDEERRSTIDRWESTIDAETKPRNQVVTKVKDGLRFAALWLLKSFFTILALVVKTFAWIVAKIRYKEPEVSPKTKCPACGYRGCRLTFIRTAGAEQAAIECTCYQCGANFYQKLVMPAEKWLAPQNNIGGVRSH